MTDIEARARAYAEHHCPQHQKSKEARVHFERYREDYLAGARAEVELERKRILDVVDTFAREFMGKTSYRVFMAELKKIIEGGASDAIDPAVRRVELEQRKADGETKRRNYDEADE